MSNSIIDGTILEAKVKRAVKRQTLFDTVTFQLADGSLKTIRKLQVANEVAGHLTAGAKGRFYLYKMGDQRGVHGIRTVDGREIAAYPRVIERLMLVLGSLNLAILIAWIMMDGEVRLLPLILGPICLGFGILLHLTGNAAMRQFAADAGPDAQPRPAIV
ncbi:hypothetical protein ACFB49_46710 [Sphingomonas sp. DBB INV C78]|uniref:hypothetical protein n=1 Tax=Sphingomonas sp. DBB INV C78 TaxID=3349434 RepID=UPI0036D3C25B